MMSVRRIPRLPAMLACALILAVQFAATAQVTSSGLMLSASSRLLLPAGSAGGSAFSSSLSSQGLSLAVPSIPADTTLSSVVGTPRTATQNLYDYTGVLDFNSLVAGNYINDVVGATRFYQTGVLSDTDPTQYVGIFGQQTYVAHIDAGHPWAGPSGHSTLTGVNVSDPNLRYSPTDGLGNSLVVTDPQSHATNIAMVIAGAGKELQDTGSTSKVRIGISPFTNLGSGAIATSIGSGGTFEMTAKTFLSTYKHFAEATWSRTVNYDYNPFFTVQNTFSAPTDVINASFGFTDPAGTAMETVAVDALARAHSKTTFVVSAGNSGPGANTVGGPASGYNVIAVGAVGDGHPSGLNKVTDFSSRGAQDFAGAPGTVVSGVRAPVHLVAPGVYIIMADYRPPNPDPGDGVAASGTSYAAPIVSAGVALLNSLSYHLNVNYEYNFENSRDSRVIKAVLMNSATKLPGWDNAQQTVNSVVRTSQALDMEQGAGLINLDRAFDQYLGGTLDPFGLAGNVYKTGWSLGTVAYDPVNPQNQRKDYKLFEHIDAGSMLDATLTWFRNRTLPAVDDATGDWASTAILESTDISMAKLTLEIWNGDFTKLYGVSESPYGDVQHLHMILPDDGNYALRVQYDGQIFGAADPAGETFGLAWSVPEPGSMLMIAVGILVLARRRPI